jgi:hypothetical protein
MLQQDRKPGALSDRLPAEVELRVIPLINFISWCAIALTMSSVSLKLLALGTRHERLVKLAAIFDVNAEHNIPTWFASWLLMMSALVAMLLARSTTDRSDRLMRSGWIISSVCFALMSLDEVVGLHERTNGAARRLLRITEHGWLNYAWVVPGLIVVATGLLLLRRFLAALPRRTLARLLLAGAVYFSGAIGVEIVGGWHAGRYGEDNPLYVALTSIEEFMEFAGAILFLRTLLLCVAEAGHDVRIRVTRD